MALFTWCDDYSVKIPSIDEQHHKLVDMLNALHDSMTSGGGSAQLEELLSSLVEYTVVHFTYEEKLLAEHEFPQTAEHVGEHQRLVEQVTAFKTRYDAGSAKINMQLMKFLKDWLIHHILGSDKSYSAYLVERGVK